MNRSRTNYLYSMTCRFPFSQIHFSTDLLPYTRSRTTSNSRCLQTLSAHPSQKPLHYYHRQLFTQNTSFQTHQTSQQLSNSLDRDPLSLRLRNPSHPWLKKYHSRCPFSPS